MPATFETGDLFATPELAGFAHGCNCAGAMGKGIAVAFRKRWPTMYEEYRKRCKIGAFTLGDVFVWQENGETVFNLGTQPSWTKRAEMWAVEKAVTTMIREAEAHGVKFIGLPRIGAGLGGLDWALVRTYLEAVAVHTTVHLRVCETFVEGVPLGSPS